MSDYLQKYNKYKNKYLYIKKQQYGGGRPDNEIKIVYGLDINGTIVDGDTFHDSTINHDSTIKLTDEMISFLDNVKERKNIGIVYFTFGADFEKISEIIDTYREVKNKYLVTKTVSTGNIIVAYKYGLSHDVEWTDLKNIGNDKWNPKIKRDVNESTVNNYHKYTGKEDNVLFTDTKALVFTSIALYNEFVMKLLKEGDVLFRATYDPDNEHFQKRTNDTKCKFLYTNSKIDTYIYDDNIQDWHNDENLHKHCKFQRALIKPNFDKILEYEKLLQLRNTLVKVFHTPIKSNFDKQIIVSY
jgi:hypothetical protein